VVLCDVTQEGDELAAYLPAVQADWLANAPSLGYRTVEGSLVFADVSGFTPLTERLARRGKVGAEELTDVLNAVFRKLLAVAGGYGGDCLKFGGDAILLLFAGDDHARRACAAARGMLAAHRPFHRLHTGAGLAELDMSVGIQSGVVHLYLAGTSHRELIVTGPAVTQTLGLETLATSGQILVSDSTARFLDRRDLGTPSDGRWPLRRDQTEISVDEVGLAAAPRVDATVGLPVALQGHLGAGKQEGEHRIAVIGFLQFGDTDRRLAEEGPAGLAATLHSLVGLVQASCAEHGVTFLATDVNKDGGKIILATGTPVSYTHLTLPTICSV